MLGTEKLAYKITKEKDKQDGMFSAPATNVKIEDLYATFGYEESSLDKNSLAKKVFGVPVTGAKISGTVYDYSTAELILSGRFR